MFVVSHVNLLHIFMSAPIQKMITHAVYLISSARETIVIDVVLEEYNNCLSIN